MRTIDPAIILAAMATIETQPLPPLPSGTARVPSRTRRTTYAPMTPPAVVHSRGA